MFHIFINFLLHQLRKSICLYLQCFPLFDEVVNFCCSFNLNSIVDIFDKLVELSDFRSFILSEANNRLDAVSCCEALISFSSELLFQNRYFILQNFALIIFSVWSYILVLYNVLFVFIVFLKIYFVYFFILFKSAPAISLIYDLLESALSWLKRLMNSFS